MASKTVTNTKTSFENNSNPDIPVAVETISSENYQLIKLIDGTPGSTDPLFTVGNPGNVTATFSETRAGSATQSSVADTASSATILASNAARLGASVFNDSSALLYLLYGAGPASATAYTVRLYPNSYHEVFGNYTGILTGIWASDPGDGAARVTELTA